MGELTSEVVRDETFERRRAAMEGLVAELHERTAQVAAGGGEKAVERHRSRGKLTARERIDRLVDPSTAFLELNALAAWGLYGGDAPSVSRDASASSSRTTQPSREARTTRSPSRSTSGPRRSRARTACPASTSSTRAARSCRYRPRSSPTVTTSAAFSSTRRACRRSASPRSPSSWARARPAGPMCPRCRTRR
jgi:hypothetical protein